MKRGKKGVSPVIATVLLISIVVVLIIVIFAWLRGTIKDAITKGGENVELVCDKVKLRASYSTPNLEIVNDGDVPVYDINVKFVGVGESSSEDLKILVTNWPVKGLSKGGSFSGNINSRVTSTGAQKLIVIPILRGASNEGEQVFDCGENYGLEVIV